MQEDVSKHFRELNNICLTKIAIILGESQGFEISSHQLDILDEKIQTYVDNIRIMDPSFPTLDSVGYYEKIIRFIMEEPESNIEDLPLNKNEQDRVRQYFIDIFGEEPRNYPTYFDQVEPNILNFGNSKVLKFEELGDCLQDIIVNQYLNKGGSGIVYSVRYKGEECIMKIVSSLDLGFGRITRTSMDDAENEAEALENAWNLGIGPKFYDFRVCKIKMPVKFGDKKIKIGIFILEKLDKTLGTLLKEYEYDIAFFYQKGDMNVVKDLFKQQFSNLQSIVNKIEEDCYLAHDNDIYISDLNEDNIMFRYDGTPIIADWGVTNGSINDCEEFGNEILNNYRDLVEDYLDDSDRAYLNSI
jgi:tRNA A-37 threonylcarbamoyl transferase component Bud32